MLRSCKTALAAIFLMAAPAAAEVELSLYMGLQSVDDSTVSGALPNGTVVNRKFKWDGNPLDNPYYYGARATWWTANNLGFGIEGTHAKAYASAADQAIIGTSRFGGNHPGRGDHSLGTDSCSADQASSANWTDY